MIALFRKEISGFFSSLTGYIVVLVFLLVSSLFMWVFPGDLNILDGGYANIDTLFMIAPWVFLFLIPAITMRMFADEKKSGTLELLLTRPLTDFQIVLAKFMAGLTLVAFSLAPALIYFLSVYLLGSPVGDVDSGATWGSFIGLFFLAAVYVSIGLFTSSVTDNIIVSFILAAILSAFMYTGFELLGHISMFQSFASLLVGLGINEHYTSLSRGVVDSRDVIYYLAVVAIFLLITKTVLNSRRW